MSSISVPDWPITDSTYRRAMCLDPQYHGDNYGYLHPPLLNVANHEIIPDELHLRIRLTLKLFNQLVSWAIDQQNQIALEHEMLRLRVPFHFWTERGLDSSSQSICKWVQPSGKYLYTSKPLVH